MAMKQPRQLRKRGERNGSGPKPPRAPKSVKHLLTITCGERPLQIDGIELHHQTLYLERAGVRDAKGSSREGHLS